MDRRPTLLQFLLTWTGLVAVLALVLIPYAYVVVTSFKSPNELFDVRWIPERWSLAGWREALGNREFLRSLWNSLLAGVGAALLSLLIAVPGAYVFARKSFPGREPLFYFIVGTLLFPFILLIVPVTITWIDLGLYNSIVGLWLAFQIFAVPYSIWILRGYFARMPRHLEECAMVYGCTQFQAFYRVMLPVAKPVIVSVAFLSFLLGWNDFLFSNMLTTGEGPRTASVAIYVASAGGERIDWNVMMVMTLVTGIPPVILYMIAQRHLSRSFGG